MSYFYLLSALLVVLSSLFVVIPLIVKVRLNRLELTNANVVKQRIGELEREVDEGLISEKDKNTAVRDLKLALVDETEMPKASDAASTTQVKWSMVALLALPAIVLGVWVYIDANQLDGLQQYITAQGQEAELRDRIQGRAGTQVTANDYAQFALVIRKRLRNDPNDAEGWRLLGQVSMVIDRVGEAVAAFEKAIQLDPRNLDLHERYARALMTTGTENNLAKARRQVDYLIGRAPQNRDYRLLLTVLSVQMGDQQTALENFRIIRQQLSPSGEFYQVLVSQLISIGIPESAIHSQANQGNTHLNSAQGRAMSASTGIQIQVSVAPELVSQIPQSGFLIVFAQNATTDSRIPLAVKRLALADVAMLEAPVVIELSDNDAMMANLTLSSTNEVRVTARISADGDVMPSAGELQGQIESLQLDKGGLVELALVINEEL